MRNEDILREELYVHFQNCFIIMRDCLPTMNEMPSPKLEMQTIRSTEENDFTIDRSSPPPFNGCALTSLNLDWTRPLRIATDTLDSFGMDWTGCCASGGGMMQNRGDDKRMIGFVARGDVMLSGASI